MPLRNLKSHRIVPVLHGFSARLERKPPHSLQSNRIVPVFPLLAAET